MTCRKDFEIPLFSGYDIVDGQQRLTTVCVFVAAAIPILQSAQGFENNANDYLEMFVRKRDVRKLHTIDEDEHFFERFIVGGEPSSEDNCTTPSQYRLLDAKRYFTELLTKLKTSEVDALVRTLWESQVLIYAVNSDTEATQIFELQNDRGKRLTNLEAVKSFLMHGLYLHAGDGTESDLKIVQSNFADIYRSVEKMEQKYGAPDEDQILSYHCIAFEEWKALEDGTYGWDKPKQLLRYLLRQELDQDKAKWIKGFSNRLHDTYKFTLQILDARDCYKCVPLGDLAVLDRTAAFWPLLLKCWKSDASNGKTDFADMVTAMVSFTFKAIIASKRSHVGQPQLRELARDFKSDFPSLAGTLAEMRNGWDIPRYFAVGLEAENFYEWWERVATYLLWRYENYLRSQPGRQIPCLPWNTIVAPANNAVRYAKDHIEPKDSNNPNLTRQVKWDPNDAQTRPFSEVFLHRLGNLVLDTISIGSAKGKGDFASRIPHYEGDGFLSQGEIVKKFASKDADGKLIWDETAIRMRHKVLVDFAMNHI